jgi:hypothetical protein
VIRPLFDFDDDIPLGDAIFMVEEGGSGAVIIPELMSYQVDGKLFDVDRLSPDFMDEELISSLNDLRDLLRANTGGERQ